MEFISLANLINLVIVILMLALYRYFDKNNRSLEKVKRFTDKVKENLSGFVDEKTEEIRNLSIDMKVNLTTAKEVLNRIGSIEVELKNKAESIDTLHKQVNKYDTLIRELNTATIVVEENLKRIHDESTFVDKVGKRIKTAQGKIDLLEKAIPVVREEIKKQNSEDLKKISDKLTQDVTQKTKSIHDVMQGVEKKVKDFSVYITRLEGRKDTMEQESIKKFDSECGKFEARMLQKKAEVAKSFKDELSGYLQEAQAQRSVHKKNMDELVQESQVEIADLEDRMLKHLIEFKKDIEQAELNFKTNLSRVVESGKNLEHDIFTELREKIKVDAEKVHGEVGKKLVGFGKEVDVRNNELIAILGKAKQNTEVWKTGIEKNIEKITQELTTSFENNKAELEATITEFIHQNEDSRKVYGAQLDDFITVSEDKMQMLESEYTKKMSDMNKSFSQFKNDYTQQLKDVDSEFEKEKEEMLLHFNETMKTVEKQCALRFEQVKKDFDQIDGVSEDIKFRMKNIKKDLQECSCDLLGKIDEFKHTFSDDLSNASTELESVIIKKVDKRISDYEKDASYRFDKLEQVQTDIESLEQGLRDLMEIKKEELKSDFSEFITHLDEKKKEEREYTNKILSEIRVEIQNLEEEVHELKAKAYQSVSEKLKVFEDDFFTDLKSRNQDMEKSIEEWRSSVKEKLQLLAAQHEQGRLEIEEKYNAEIQTEMSGLEAKTKELFTLFKKQWKETLSGEFKTYKSEFSQNSVEFKKEVDDILLEIKNNFSSQRDSITKEADKEREIITEEIASLNVKLDAYKSDFDRNAEDYKEEVKNIILDIKDNFTSQRDTIIKEAHEESKIIDNEILSLNTKLDEYKEEFYRNTKDLKDEVKDIIADITNNFASRRDTIIKETNEESKIIDEEITSLKMKLEAYKTEFNKNTEEYKEEVEDMILTIKNDFSSGRDELFKETEEKGQVLNDKLEKLGQRLDVFDSKFSDRTNNVLRDFQSKYEQKQGDFTKRLRELQSEFELKIKDFKTTIAQGTTMVSAAQKEQKSELKSMEDQIKNLNKQLNLAAKDALSTCNTEFHKLQEEFISRMKTFDESMVKKIAGFDASFKSSQEKVKLSHDKYAERVDGEYKALLTNLKDIEKQQQNFVSQTKLFERADSLKITLKNEIEDIRKDILLLDPINKKMKTLEGELIKMNKLSEEMYAKTTRYAAEKRRIDSMEKNFKQLLKISDTIDDKLETVTTSYDTLQEIKIRIRELGELGKEVQAQYERLEKKQEVLDTTTIGVDKSFRILEDLEKEIKRIDTTVEGLSPKMLTIDQEIKYLVENKPKADNAVEQMQKLNDLMSDIEERTQKLNKARDWLARTETRLESINKNAQDQLSMLKALMKEDGTNGKKIKGAPKQDKREMIIKLARQGWLSKEISKATNTSLGEVELILELEPKSR